ncbi:MAG: PstA family ABC transporter permease [Candidatus Binatia bacterium]
MRHRVDHLITLAAGLCAALAIGVIAFIVGALIWRGATALSWQFLTEHIRLVGAAGGVFYNIVGTLILAATALLVSTPLAIGAALVHSVYLRSERSRERLWLVLSAWNGVPSILLGLFGLMVFVKFFGWGKSWLAGGVLLGFMILPVAAVALIERIQALPRRYIEAAAGLGLRQGQVVWWVILPQCSGGLVTGSLLGVARAAGETAPVMFTATIFAGATLPRGVMDSPVLTLPYHIFVLSQDSFDPSVGAKIWGAALVLLLLVFGLSVAALPWRLRMHEEARDG